MSVALLGGPVTAAPGDDFEQQLQEAEEKAAAARDEVDELSEDAAAARDELVELNQRLSGAERRLNQANGQVALAEQELDEREQAAEEAAAAAAAAADELERVEGELAAEEQTLGDQLARAWMNGSATRTEMVYEMLQSAESPSDVAADLYRVEVVLDDQASTVDTVDRLRGEQEVALVEARDKRQQADQQRQAAADAVTVVEGLRDEAAALQASVEADRNRQSEVLAAVEADADQARAVLASVEAEGDRIEADRQAAIAAAEAEAQAEAEAEADSGGTGAAGGSSSASGACPVQGASAQYDFSNDWGYPRSGGRSHEGTDMFANRGTPVRSVGSGTVQDVGNGGLGGLTVSISVASGEHWYYAHMDSIASGISEGVAVSDGQQIGTVGDSGNARGTPPHLHIGHYVGGGAINPYPIVAGRCP